MINYLIVILALFFSCNKVQAKELYGPSAGVVPFGMGRAYSAVADDWLSLYYNPAGLAMVNKVDFQAFDLKVGTNKDVLDSYSNIKNLSNGSGSIANTLNSYTGKHIAGEVSNFSQITVPYFALGLSYEVKADVDLQNTAYPQTYARYTKDLGINLGGAIAFGKQKDLRIGTRVQFLRRQGGEKTITIDQIAGSSKSLLDRFTADGTGFSGALGVQYRLPTKGRIEVTTSFVWHDIGQTAFGSITDKNRPTIIDQNMVAGMGVRLPIGGRQNRRTERRYGVKRSTNALIFAADYSHLNISPSKEQYPKHFHLGMNLDLPIISIQMGVNQTSLTFGAAFDISILRVSAATYAEELGNYAGQRTDRRYLVSVGSALGFKGF